MEEFVKGMTGQLARPSQHWPRAEPLESLVASALSTGKLCDQRSRSHPVRALCDKNGSRDCAHSIEKIARHEAQ